MNEKELLNYEAPQVEVVEVEVEKGFAGSSGQVLHHLVLKKTGTNNQKCLITKNKKK